MAEMDEIEKLRKRVQELEAEVAALKAQPKQEFHYHYPPQYTQPLPYVPHPSYPPSYPPTGPFWEVWCKG